MSGTHFRSWRDPAQFCPAGLALIATLLCSGSGLAAPLGLPAPEFQLPVATFSIVAADTVNDEIGVAVASRFLAVGSVVPWAEAGVGAVATQAIANTRIGVEGLVLLKRGLDAGAALGRLLDADSNPSIRQVGLVDAQGGSATYTGDRCQSWAGGINGPGFAIQGNILAGEAVVNAMAAAYQTTDGTLAERLLAALAAGDKEGGDRRGKQSAALLVVKPQGGYGGANDRYIDLRVDDAENPVAELARIYRIHARVFLPTVHVRLGDQALALGDRTRADREFSRAINLYREAIAERPEDPEPKNGLAWFYAQHRVNLAEAVDLAQESLRLSPGSWEVLDTLAEICAVRGQTREALGYAMKALESDPGNPYLREQADRFQAAVEREEQR
jgi:uncharacterized Ntn-hydrolase superfamily protein